MQEHSNFSFKKLAAHALPAEWGRGSQVVDGQGCLLPVFRGEHGAGDAMGQSALGSLSFGSAEAASLYALQPNDRNMVVQAPKVFPVFLDIRKPLVAEGDDPFLDLSRYAETFGVDEACRVALKFKDYVCHTNAWEELADDYSSLETLAELRPDVLMGLYFEVYALLDDPDEVARLRAAGFDGAIYGGSGATALEPEYRVFSTDQVKSVWDRDLNSSN